jgi:triacylglycerol lipase
MKTRRFFILFTVFLLYCLFGGSVSASEPAAPENLNTEPEQSGLSLKYPVVLVHGIALRDPGFAFNSWGKIPHVLRENGVEVHFGDTDAWGTIESNAGLLKAAIDKILEETGKEKVNIIAHSKGGLDSRYFIWKYDYGDKVASLTTISTPHHGSVVADLVQTLKTLHTRAAKRSLEELGKLYEDAYPDAYTVGHELTTRNMRDFNRIITMDNRVYYQSIYSTMSKASDDPFFAASYKYIKIIIGENDGLVSEYSARWGNNIIKIDGGISHGQIIDIMGQRMFEIEIPKIEGLIPEVQIIDLTGKSQLETKVLDVYLGIVNDLSNRGF